MSDSYAKDLWTRAENAMKSAEVLLPVSPDDAASRAYYAVFHAVSAAFALVGRVFKKHTEVRAAVHRDWVKHGDWTVELGADFDAVWELRDLGDYGGMRHVAADDAAATIEAARRILATLRARYPTLG